MTAQTICYPRAPSDRLRELLMQGGFLAPILALNGRMLYGTELDVHFRIKDEIQVYCGLTRVLTVKMLQRPNGYLKIDADGRYTGQAVATDTRLFRCWSIDEVGFGKAIEAYLDRVDVNPSLTTGEGTVQSLWSRVKEPWIPFDREGRLNYKSTEHRERAERFPEVEAAFKSIQTMAEECGWKEPRCGARKVDQLAIDRQGRLVLLELKDASKKPSEVYYVPFQLLQYVWRWHSALAEVRDNVQELIEARVDFGLTPPSVPRLTGGIRAVVGFGQDKRTPKVTGRYGKVLDIVNRHLPPGVAPIETWEHPGDKPRRIS